MSENMTPQKQLKGESMLPHNKVLAVSKNTGSLIYMVSASKIIVAVFFLLLTVFGLGSANASAQLMQLELTLTLNHAGMLTPSTNQMPLVIALSRSQLMGALKKPSAIFYDETKKRLYVADTDNDRLVSFDSEFNFLADFDAGGQLKKPTGVIRNSKGEFYILSGVENGLFIIDIPNKIFKKQELTGIPAKGNPVVLQSIAVDMNDNLYLIDKGNGRILVLNSKAQFMREITLKNGPVDFSDIRLDGSGNIYTLSAMERKVYIFNSKGEIISSFGKRGNRPEEFWFPVSLTIDKNGLIYVLDRHKGSVAVFNSEGEFQSHFFRYGWVPGELYRPSYIHIDSSGTLYIVDQGNNRIQIFNAEKM